MKLRRFQQVEQLMLLLPRREWVFVKQNRNAIQLKPFHDTDEELQCLLLYTDEALWEWVKQHEFYTHCQHQ